jgi:ABC-type Mn2+/Zn2+ transport system permease subunit
MSWWDSAVHRALVEAVLAGVLAGLVGVQVVLRRLAFFTMAMTHATFPGVVLAAIIGVNIYLGGAVFGVLISLAVLALGRRPGQEPTAATGVVLSAGFALGVGLVATRNGFTKELSAFLVGSILAVSSSDLVVTSLVLAGVSVGLVLFGKELLLVGFDPVGARAANYPTWLLDLFLLLVIEAVIVTLVPAVGTILAVALIVAPAAAARLWSDRLMVTTIVAVGLGVTAGVAGLYLSNRYDLAGGATITLTAAGLLVISLVAAPHGLRPRLVTAHARRHGSPPDTERSRWTAKIRH